MILLHSPVVQSEFIFESAPFRSCHASTIVKTRNGVLLAAWFGGTKEGAKDVGIYLSRRGPKSWSSPTEIATGTDEKGDPTPCWNPVLFQPKNGPLTLYYRIGPTITGWKGWEKTSNDDGLHWSAPQPLPKDILGPIKNKPIQLASGRILAGSSEEKGGWTVHFEYSDDNGATWNRTKKVNFPTDFGAIQPSLLEGEEGAVYAVGRTNAAKLFYIASADEGKDWGEMQLIDVDNPNSGIDAVKLRSGLYLLVYNNSNAKRTPLDLAISKDAIHWKHVMKLETKPGEYSYPAIIQTPDGLVHITYTWKRVRIKHVVVDPAEFASLAADPQQK